MQMTTLDFLGLIFITLKLTGYIDWSWGWVLSPIIFMTLLRLLAQYLVNRQ